MAVVLKLNGKDINSLEQLKESFENEKDEFLVFDLLYGTTPLILPTKLAKAKNDYLLRSIRFKIHIGLEIVTMMQQLLTGDSTMKKIILALFFISSLSEAVKDSMIRFDCYKQKTDPSSPWSKSSISVSTGNAVKLKKENIFLTTFEAVNHSEYCEWKILNSNDRIPLKVLHKDPSLGLAY